MNDCCPTCGFPMVWSEDNRREWCSVYGDHPAVRHSSANRGAGLRLVRLLVDADKKRNSHGCSPSAPQGETRTIVA